MPGDSLANTLSFLSSQLTGNRQIPAASDEFLQSANNPNIRNFAPGQEPQFRNPILAMLMGGAGRNAGQGVGQSLALQQQPPSQDGGFMQKLLGLDNVGNAISQRQAQIDAALKAAQ